MTVTAPKTDAVLLAASDLARSVLEDVAEPGTVGAHLGMDLLQERLGMHWFECTSPGYRGWRWGVSVARVSRAKVATVCETNLLPGPDAVLAPEWLPYADRLAPGDLGAGDVLPFRPDDPNLEAGFEATGEEDVDQMAFFELGLGRPRVLSAEGREVAASRWYDGDHGPTAEIATKATEHCTTCGYFLPMAGALRATFGVCANEWSPSDGRVVSLDHGCGAHSETDLDHPEPTPVGEPIVDEFAVDLEPAERADRDDEDQADQSADDQGQAEDESSQDDSEQTGSEQTGSEQTGSQETRRPAGERAPAEESHGSDDPVTD